MARVRLRGDSVDLAAHLIFIFFVVVVQSLCVPGLVGP